MVKNSGDSQKLQLRELIRTQRRSRLHSPAAAQETTATLNKHVLGLCKGHSSVIAYAALPGEPDVDAALDVLTQTGTTVFLPVTEKLGTALRFGVLTSTMAKLPKVGPWQIRQPATTHSTPEVLRGVAGFEPPSLVIIPGLAFGFDGARLGNGGGFYDRTFGPCGQFPLAGPAQYKRQNLAPQADHSAQSRIQTVGVCFSAEYGLRISAQAWDLKVQQVVTERGISDCAYN